MSNWWQKERGKAALAEELRRRGWTVHGYTPDRSDPTTDYYAPAFWDGVATKDNAVLVVDLNFGFDGEQVVGKRVYTTVHYLKKFGVTWQANPPRKNWHVERGGRIIASGNGVNSIYGDKSVLNRILADIEHAVTNNDTADDTAIDTAVTAVGYDPTMIGTVSVGRNPAKAGIEIKFSAKPAESILAQLHAAGFRFSYRQSLWYAKDTPDNWDAAMRIYNAAMLRDDQKDAARIVDEKWQPKAERFQKYAVQAESLAAFLKQCHCHADSGIETLLPTYESQLASQGFALVWPADSNTGDFAAFFPSNDPLPAPKPQTSETTPSNKVESEGGALPLFAFYAEMERGKDE